MRMRRGGQRMEEHLIRELRRRFRQTPPAQRISEIREFMSKSPVNKRLMKKAFPELYREAISSASRFSGGGPSEPNQPVELFAKPR